MGEEDNLGSKGRDSEAEPHSWAQITKPNFDSNQATIDVCESSDLVSQQEFYLISERSFRVSAEFLLVDKRAENMSDFQKN